MNFEGKTTLERGGSKYSLKPEARTRTTLRKKPHFFFER